MNYKFPSGIAWSQRYITGGDCLLKDSYITLIGNLWVKCSNEIVWLHCNTSNVTNMSYMFDECKSLKTIIQLDTSNVTNMTSMFYYCEKLTSIPQLDTSNVTNMRYMFYRCSSLTSIPQMDTSNVKDMNSMFYGCEKLTSIPLLDCGKVTNKYDSQNILNGCKSLTDLGGFMDLKVSITSGFLEQSTNLTTESLMNVINNLYDLTANGLSGETLKFGTTNLNKLTSDQIAVATNKGWTLT